MKLDYLIDNAQMCKEISFLGLVLAEGTYERYFEEGNHYPVFYDERMHCVVLVDNDNNYMNGWEFYIQSTPDKKDVMGLIESSISTKKIKFKYITSDTMQHNMTDIDGDLMTLEANINQYIVELL